MTPDTSGPTLRVPSAYFDPNSSSWRTSGVMFPSDWPTSSQTCPAWGMTRRGELFELPTPAHPTDAPASSSLLPTPVADHSRGLPQPGTDFQSLPNVAISLLPTPAVNDMGAGKTVEDQDAWTARMQERHGNGNGHGASLSIEALRLLPTPQAHDAVDGKTPEQVEAMRRRTGAGVWNLNEVAANELALLPTPTAMDSAGSRNATARRPEGSQHHAGTTLTDVFWLAEGRTDMPLLPTPMTQTGGAATRSGDRSDEMLLPAVAMAASSGALTPPPLPDGKQSSDDQLPGQLSLDETGQG
jgi:hypothetical protein